MRLGVAKPLEKIAFHANVGFPARHPPKAR